MLFRQLFDVESSTYTYLLADEETHEAVLIDPVLEQFERDRGIVQELELKLVHVLDTHVHADHITSSGLFREQLGVPNVVSERAQIACADTQAKQGDIIRFGRHELEVRETPGHTDGCITYVCHAEGMAFTGDAVLIRGCGRTDFQQGNPVSLFHSVREQVFSLPDKTLIYPAHDYKGRTVTTVGEERRLNPRLGEQNDEQAFVKIMRELKLPYPKKIDVAVPGNSRCGLPPEQNEAKTAAVDTSWAPVAVSTAGVPEVTSAWLRGAPSSVTVWDVREPDEYYGELGHLENATLVPMGTVSSAVRFLSPDTPLVLVCRSGGRSGKAAYELAAAGMTKVASLRGGMLGWNAESLPIERGHIQSRQG